MPSPFPGMDPFIEGQKFKGFHTRFVAALGDALVPLLRPRYVVDVEEFVYLTGGPDDSSEVIEPDVHVAEGEATFAAPSGGTALASPAPVTLTLPTPERIRQPYLRIHTRESADVVTVIELLSPWNKSGEGRRQYLAKRHNILATPSNLVEIDLLRGGTRLPTVEPLPPGDYFALACRRTHYPKVNVYSWSLREAMPPIAVPLREEDENAIVSLQEVFTTVYDRAGFDYSLDYSRPLAPPVGDDANEWIRETLGR